MLLLGVFSGERGVNINIYPLFFVVKEIRWEVQFFFFKNLSDQPPPPPPPPTATIVFLIMNIPLFKQTTVQGTYRQSCTIKQLRSFSSIVIVHSLLMLASEAPSLFCR